MAYLNTTTRPTLLDLIRHAASAAKTRWAAYRVYRNTFEELSSLTDRELSDLGLSRTELRTIALEATRG